MIHLTPTQQETLDQVRRAGMDGVPFNDLSLSDAICLAVDELVRVRRTERRVFITPKGEAFAMRTAA